MKTYKKAIARSYLFTRCITATKKAFPRGSTIIVPIYTKRYGNEKAFPRGSTIIVPIYTKRYGNEKADADTFLGKQHPLF